MELNQESMHSEKNRKLISLETGPDHLSSFVLNQFENIIHVQRQLQKTNYLTVFHHGMKGFKT